MLNRKGYCSAMLTLPPSRAQTSASPTSRRENRYVVRARERHRERLAMSGSFSAPSSEELALVVDGIEEVEGRGER